MRASTNQKHGQPLVLPQPQQPRKNRALLTLTAFYLVLCLMLSSCSQRVYVPVVEVIAPPASLYTPKEQPLPPVTPGQRLTPRQLAEWLSRYIAWGGEMSADRAALAAWVQEMQNKSASTE